MSYLIAFHWGWLLCALVIGGLVGWMTWLRLRDRWMDAAVWIVAAIFVCGLIGAVLKLLHGRAGYWLDLALLMIGTYIIGCLLGWALRALTATTAGARQTDDQAPATAASQVASMAQAPSAPQSATSQAALTSQPAAPAVPLTDSPSARTAGLSGAASQASAAMLTPSTAQPASTAAPLAASPAAATTQPSATASQSPAATLTPSAPQAATSPAATTPLPAAPLAASPVATTTQLSATALPAAAAMATPTTPPESATLPVSPQPTVTLPDEHKHAGQRPEGYLVPRDNKADDLKRIKGIGKQNEGRLHGLGVWHFDQIAAWTLENVKWVGSYLAFRGRIENEKWTSKTRVRAAARQTEFAKRVDAGLVKTSRDDGSQGQDNVEKAEPKGK